MTRRPGPKRRRVDLASRALPGVHKWPGYVQRGGGGDGGCSAQVVETGGGYESFIETGKCGCGAYLNVSVEAKIRAAQLLARR